MSTEDAIREKIRKLEEALVEGRISEETYRELKAKYEAELERIRSGWAEVEAPAAAPSRPRVGGEGLGDLFNRALDFVKANPSVLVPPILAGILGAIIMAGIGISALGLTGLGGLRGFGIPGPPTPGPGYPPEVPPSVFGLLGLVAVGMILVTIIQQIFNGWLIAMVKRGVRGGTVDLGSSFNEAVSKAGPIVAASILVGIIVGIGLLLCVLPGLVAAILLALTLQAVVIDDYGPVDALKVSYNVVKENFIEVLIVMVAAFVAEAIVDVIPYIGFILSAAVGGFFSVLLTLLYMARRPTEARVAL